eukprot:CAMPEP_0185567034 /NCGR_PEP_ID=MMETSP0434-20130131/425_1 /TAXON_ID=626734 ORGANISM="Favella taraikaensis, Strain Fe Narragansett Bay" /NCGR_SAMPLE_ID=MMETSP0434 /ASSEMBLY_ACC=CAM_ASM_000379 /LENGTH=139 /DNA_ID=CAMNT_0028181141 /DNA_START=322 /DNA_END=742 /DNA_ORIENTATION=-
MAYALISFHPNEPADFPRNDPLTSDTKVDLLLVVDQLDDNAGFNYGNRNASSTQTTNELLVAYSKATVTAVGIACGLRALAPFIIGTSQGTLARLTNYFIGYCAVATSSSVNVVAMRERELETGIGVRGQDSGEEIGLS